MNQGANEIRDVSDAVVGDSSFSQVIDRAFQTSDMYEGANEIQTGSDAVVGESSNESYLKFLISGQTGGGKRARSSGDVEPLATDPTEIKTLIDLFKNTWDIS